MTSPSGADRPRTRFFERFTEPFADRARERIEHAEDKVRDAIQAEIDAVSASVRARAVRIRPSAIAFGVAALLTVFGLALIITAAVLGLNEVLEPWLSALLVGVVLIGLAAGAAAWGRNHLPSGPPVSIMHAPQIQHPAEEQVHPWAD
ncbi:phage holin family protein [Cellulomonas soli]|uniref:phage holin family protein n=1 Tax=Cellulomonas soli TaxID=931535 RepID=UPI003F86BC77